jgi:hypothetical protein
MVKKHEMYVNNCLTRLEHIGEKQEAPKRGTRIEVATGRGTTVVASIRGTTEKAKWMARAEASSKLGNDIIGWPRQAWSCRSAWGLSSNCADLELEQSAMALAVLFDTLLEH